MDEKTKWGETFDDTNVKVLGSNSHLKICIIHFVVTFTILVILKPIVVTNKTNTVHKPHLAYMKILIITLLIVIGTYFLPPLIRNKKLD
mgnify:CR=1 FL=1